MKRFIQTSALFLSILLLLCLGIEVALLWFPNQHSAKIQYMEEHLDDINTLFLGNSHIAQGVDPLCYAPDSAYNLAISGRLNYYDAALAERFIPRMKNIKNVFMTMSYNGEYSAYIPNDPTAVKQTPEEKRYMDFQRFMYRKYMGISYGADVLGGIGNYSDLINSTNSIIYRLLGKTKDAYEQEDRCKGFVEPLKLENKEANWDQKKLPRIINPNTEYHKKKWDLVHENYRKIAKACQARNARLILVTTPFYITARNRVNERGLDDLERFVNMLKEEFPNIHYINLMADPRFEEDDFFDSSHMTTLGAKKMAEILRTYADSISNK